MSNLASHIHLAALGEDVVLLDTRADAYLCIPDGVAHLRPDGCAGQISPTGEAQAALAAVGYLAGDEASPPRVRAPRPRRDLDVTSATDPTLRDIWRLALALADLPHRYWRRDLGQILAFAARSQPVRGGSAAPNAAGETERLARVFHQLAPWLPMSAKCLIRSFVLLRFLQRSGLRAQWVFGVATWPFAAHCWIQTGDMVLDDHWERLLAYEPILVVA